jgi:hypothetical protein
MNWTWTFPKLDHSFRPALAAQKNLLSFWNGVDARFALLPNPNILSCRRF